ncbi:MAG: polysaccharide biosynthesis protein [Casimicrobiaceae bacterium]
MSLPMLADLEDAVTGRSRSYFADDIADHQRTLRTQVEGRNVLVVGGGGSIGSATTRAVLALRPASIDIVDISENYLAEQVREIRSCTADTRGIDLQAHVLDYGALAMRRLLAAGRRFDVVLNFAAVKHVRSERDVFSLLHMLDVNIVRQARFKRWLAELGHHGRYFTVSTDKAANPSSLMGASKRVMEDVAFDTAPGAFDAVTSARFANVAFSNGSLLQSFIMRLQKRQPLAVPVATRRYFISHAEAADVCLLAALAAPGGHVLVPTLRPEEHLLVLQDVVRRVLASCGYTPWFTDDEAAAKSAMKDAERRSHWPVLLTPLDTMGEKSYEEFVGDGECLVQVGFTALQGIAHRPGLAIEPLLAELSRYIDDPSIAVDKERLSALLLTMVPTMRHVNTGRHLDARM